MVKSCWICKTSGNKLKKSYFRIPKILLHRNPEISELSALRMKKWRHALLLPDDISGIRICSDHFLSGNPARLLDVNDPDWIPTKNLDKISKKEAVTLTVFGQKDGQISCRLCSKLVKNEFCTNIFENVNKKIIGMITVILGHKIAFSEGTSPCACSSCLKKVRVCARLLKYFRRNEKRFLKSFQNDMKCTNLSETRQNGRTQETGGIHNDAPFSGVDHRKNERKRRIENEVGCEVSEEVFSLTGNSYNSEQIRSIVEDNSMSSEGDPTESRKLMKCKRRKYDIQSVNVKPIEVKTLKCNNCYKKFDDLDGLKNHKNFCKLFYCQLCKPQAIFTEKEEQEKHKKKYHCHSLVCHICGKYYSQSYLVKHFKNHFEKRQKCPFCGKILKNKTIFMTHIDKSHSNRFSTVCEVCGAHFKNLKKHLALCRK